MADELDNEVSTSIPETPLGPPAAAVDDDLDLSWGTPVSAESDAPIASDEGVDPTPVADNQWSPDSAVGGDAAGLDALTPSEPPKEGGGKNRIFLFAGIGAVAVVAIVVAIVLIATGGLAGIGKGPLAAKVNREVITVKQLDAEIAKIKLQSPQIFDGETGMEEGAVRKSLLDELINRLLIEEAASKDGVKVEDSQVETQVASIRSGYADEKSFNEALKGAGYTLETLSSQIRYDLFLQGLITKKVPDNSITDAEVKAYYDENKAQFVEPAGKKASHILFDLSDKEKAKQVLADLRRSTDLEKDFAKAAEENSTDTQSAKSGGDLGWPTTGYVEAFQKALDKLDINEMSNLVKTEFGYHIILATDERKESTKPFKEVQQQIKDQLLNTKRNEAYQGLLESLRKEAKIEIVDPVILAYDKKQEEAAKTGADAQQPAAPNGAEQPPADSGSEEATTAQ